MDTVDQNAVRSVILPENCLSRVPTRDYKATSIFSNSTTFAP